MQDIHDSSGCFSLFKGHSQSFAVLRICNCQLSNKGLHDNSISANIHFVVRVTVGSSRDGVGSKFIQKHTQIFKLTLKKKTLSSSRTDNKLKETQALNSQQTEELMRHA